MPSFSCAAGQAFPSGSRNDGGFDPAPTPRHTVAKTDIPRGRAVAIGENVKQDIAHDGKLMDMLMTIDEVWDMANCRFKRAELVFDCATNQRMVELPGMGAKDKPRKRVAK
jgi:hypothetical protein